jgi:hypothetical protein
MIEFRTLGTIDLRDPGGVAVRSVLSQPKRLALFAYLVLERPDDLHRRDTLLGVFWPDLEDERARAILRKSLHYVRRSLGGDVLVGHGAGDEVSIVLRWCHPAGGAGGQARHEGHPEDSACWARHHGLPSSCRQQSATARLH